MILKQITGSFRRNAERLRTLREHARWRASQAPGVALLREFFEAVQLTAEHEQNPQIEAIESLRRKLLEANDQVLEFKDYGAGNPGAEYSTREASEGVVVQRRVPDICRDGGLATPYRELIYWLVRFFKPATVFELGTSLGLTAAYISAALDRNGGGKLITLDGAEVLAELATRNLASLGVNNVEVRVGRFQDTLPGLLSDNQPVDLAFIDGHHDGEATLGYLETFRAFLSPRAVLVFDDLNNYASMKTAWKKIASARGVRVALRMRKVGICLFDNEGAGNEQFDIPLEALTGSR